MKYLGFVNNPSALWGGALSFCDDITCTDEKSKIKKRGERIEYIMERLFVLKSAVHVLEGLKPRE